MSAVGEDAEKQRLLGIIRDIDEQLEFLDQMKERQQKGWEAARQCALLLKEQFGAQRVVLFGSLLEPEQMSWHSDIDLAVWGLPESSYFRAVSRLLDVEPEFSVDLVEVQHAKPHILKAIETEGVEL